MKNISRIALFLLFLLSPLASHSVESVEEAGGYRLHYRIFNSVLLTQPVVKAHQLIRRENQVYINIAMTELDEAGNESLGREAIITGQAKNLLGQIRELQFQKIDEQGVIYYLAPLQHSNEEVFHFDIQARPAPGENQIQVRFTRKLFVEKSE